MKETKETQVQSLGQEDPLEEGKATHSTILFFFSNGVCVCVCVCFEE